MIALWKGKNPIYFGVIMSKVKVTVTINRIAYFVMHTFLVHPGFNEIALFPPKGEVLLDFRKSPRFSLTSLYVN